MSEKPYSASFLVSESCNLNCSYCFEKNKQNLAMSLEIASRAVDFLFENFLENVSNNTLSMNQDFVDITLFGGEPFLNFDAIRVILKRAEFLKQETRVNFSVGIITNGTIINDDIITTLRDFNEKHNNLHIQLSIDGIKESHDYYRKYYDGRGSFDTVENNIPKFKEIFGGENFLSTERYWPKLHVHGSLNKKTIATMYESWKYFTEVMKIPRVWFMPIHDEEWTEEDVKMYDDQLSSIANDILVKSITQNNISYVRDYAPLNKCIGERRIAFSKPCGAGVSYCSFTALGDIYPCHQFYYIDKEQFKIGTVADGLDENRRLLYVRYDETDMNCYKKGCKNYSCYRCIAENYSKNGTILNCEIGKRCDMSSVEERIRQNMNSILTKYGL